MTKSVLVTGGSGFVGANLVRRLVSDGHDVHLFVRPGFQTWRLRVLLPHVHLHFVNLEDAESVSSSVRNIRPEWVFHLAVLGAYPHQTDAASIMRTNIFGTMNIVLACVRVGTPLLVNTGSSSEYGYKDHPPREDEWLEPNSYYAVAKASATLFCRYTAQREGCHLPTLRLYSVYGPFEDPARLMPRIVTCGLNGRLPPLTRPDTARDFVYIEDAVEAYMRTTMSPPVEPGPVYNIGTGRQTTIREVVDIAKAVFNLEEAPAWGSMGDREWDRTTWVADSHRAQIELGWQPRVALSDGVRLFRDWLDANPELFERYVRLEPTELATESVHSESVQS